ncbi:Cytochrome b5-like 2 [Homarus americanus]|uniref:Cytochrome b5-like 2 n=1 Tax=Homarus americanus TaxID=6706 RepID=A0A8J5T0E7_HOMAM|nr:Cytochrome b5-like 2 [Homarus americanus]
MIVLRARYRLLTSRYRIKMKESYSGMSLYVLQPKALLNFAAQSLGYRDPCATTTTQCSDRQKDEESGLQVFDVTRFLLEHPGGEEVMMEHAGRDATIAFRGVGHSVPALQALDDYLVGILPGSERIFTGDGPCQWSTL